MSGFLNLYNNNNYQRLNDGETPLPSTSPPSTSTSPLSTSPLSSILHMGQSLVYKTYKVLPSTFISQRIADLGKAIHEASSPEKWNPALANLRTISDTGVTSGGEQAMKGLKYLASSMDKFITDHEELTPEFSTALSILETWITTDKGKKGLGSFQLMAEVTNALYKTSNELGSPEAKQKIREVLVKANAFIMNQAPVEQERHSLDQAKQNLVFTVSDDNELSTKFTALPLPIPMTLKKSGYESTKADPSI